MDSGNKSGSSSGGSQSGGAGLHQPQSEFAAAALQAGMGNAPITFHLTRKPCGGSTNHNGIDLGAAEGTPTPVDGTVDDVGSQGGPGRIRYR